MSVFDQLGGLPKEERPQIGRRANEVKRLLEATLAARTEELSQAALVLPCKPSGWTSPCRAGPLPRGRLHPATLTLRQISHIFAEMGFQVYRVARSRDG